MPNLEQARVFNNPEELEYGRFAVWALSRKHSRRQLDFLARKSLEIRQRAIATQLPGLSKEQVALVADPDSHELRQKTRLQFEASLVTGDEVYLFTRLLLKAPTRPWHASIVGVARIGWADGRLGGDKLREARSGQQARHNMILLKGLYVDPRFLAQPGAQPVNLQNRGLGTATMYAGLKNIHDALPENQRQHMPVFALDYGINEGGVKALESNDFIKIHAEQGSFAGIDTPLVTYEGLTLEAQLKGPEQRLPWLTGPTE